VPTPKRSAPAPTRSSANTTTRPSGRSCSPSQAGRTRVSSAWTAATHSCRSSRRSAPRGEVLAAACDLRCDLRGNNALKRRALNRRKRCKPSIHALLRDPLLTRTDNANRRFAGLFKPSDGLEPSTPSLPWSFGGNWSQPTAMVSARFRPFRGRSICHRLPQVATARLHKGSIERCPLWLRSVAGRNLCRGIVDRSRTSRITRRAARRARQ
jgi:hypothetical protein